MSVSDPPLSFPPITGFDGLDDPDRWRWPKPPFVWHHAQPTPIDRPQPCRVETTDGQTEEGELLGFEPAHSGLRFRGPATRGQPVDLTFRQCRRLTLLDPLRPEVDGGRHLADALPLAAHERRYALQPRVPGAVLTGRTVGHVETPEGLFLFEPVDDDQALQRVFASRAANGASELGASALDVAMRGWAGTPAELVQATEAMRHRPVPRIGDTVMALGLLTPAQMAQAVDLPDDPRPLGERLVALGLLSPAQLEAVLAHKMGCPVADLTRFPADPAALALMPHRLAMGYRTLPLCVDAGRLFVASDLAMSEEKRRSIQVFVNLTVVPVLAHSAHLTEALRAVPQAAWSARSV